MAMLKARLKAFARQLAGVPLIGRVVRLAIALFRLPAFQARQQLFEAEHLPSLLRSLADLNHRQLALGSDHDNFVKSGPVALRLLTREFKVLRSDVERLRASLEGRPLPAPVYERPVDPVEDLRESVSYLLGRVEFVRRELMFEMRYGASAPTRGDSLRAQAQILVPDKVAAARAERLRINLGCGDVPLDGYVNVDRRALPGVDVIAEIDDLPFEAGEVAEISSAHLLEHFPEEQLRRQLLPYFASLLRPGGRFRATVPDAEAMMREYSRGEYPYEDLRDVIYGGQDYDGDYHFNMFTPASLTGLLNEAGFTDVAIVAAGRRNGRCYEFEIVATKPSA